MEFIPTQTVKLGLSFIAVLALGAGGSGIAHAATLTALDSFNSTNGSDPYAGLITDAAGNLFGTTAQGGTSNNGGNPNGNGTVFEIAKSGSGFASTPTTLASFNSTNGEFPVGGLIADVAGNLFGTTKQGGRSGVGTVFEIAKSGSGFASTPTTLASLGFMNSYPVGGLIADAAGNLFGTTTYGGSPGNDGSAGVGTVFEIAKISGGFASTATTLASFNHFNGALPNGGLIADAAGNLFGTTQQGGDFGYGTVFEIAKSGSGFASTPTTLASFNSTNGASSSAGLIADVAGNLFGTTAQGGTLNYGTVFEIAKSGSGFASTPTTLASFNNTNGAFPAAGLIADVAGNLFGTTFQGGTSGVGTVFELAKSGSGFASTPTTLGSFDTVNTGAHPAYGVLIADNAGNLFGTAVGGGTFGHGTVFEVTSSGFQTSVPTVDTPEPASMTLLGVGLIGLAAARRRWLRKSR